MTRATIGAAALVTSALFAAAPAAAQARHTYVQPYIELDQVVAADLSNSDDVLTYTQLAVGVDAGVNTARAQGQISYRYERRFDWGSDIGDTDVHSGLARVDYAVAPGLSLTAGGIATRTRSDIRGAAPGNLAGNPANVTQLYSAYAGPSFSTTSGPFQINAQYLFGYTKVETPDVAYTPAFGQPRLDGYDDSTSHLLTGSIGSAAGALLPVAVTLSGAYEREDQGQLDARYEGAFGRGDVTLPVSPVFAVRAGAGYERILSTARDPLVDAAGIPQVDASGRYVTDPTSPRRTSFDTDGWIYDAGLIWRPSPRLEFAGNAGYRYGGETYWGTLSYSASRGVGLQVAVYDGIETFGRQLRDALRDLPDAFSTQIDPFGQQFSGCVFGAQPGGGPGSGARGTQAGGCLNSAFQSISTSTYRARGVDGVLTAVRGRSTYGFGAGYANRKLYAPHLAPGYSILGDADQSAYGQFFWSRELSRVSALDASLYGNWYKSGLPGADDVYGWGGTGTYSHNFGRLGTTASLGLYGYDTADIDAQWTAQALLGARYSF